MINYNGALNYKDEELQNERVLLPEGDYNFVIIEVKDNIEKFGHPTFQTHFKLTSDDGVTGSAIDNIRKDLPADAKDEFDVKAKKRASCFYKTTGTYELVNTEGMPLFSFKGKTGKLHLSVSKCGKYNNVSWYVIPKKEKIAIVSIDVSAKADDKYEDASVAPKFGTGEDCPF